MKNMNKGSFGSLCCFECEKEIPTLYYSECHGCDVIICKECYDKLPTRLEQMLKDLEELKEEKRQRQEREIVKRKELSDRREDVRKEVKELREPLNQSNTLRKERFQNFLLNYLRTERIFLKNYEEEMENFDKQIKNYEEAIKSTRERDEK